MTSYLWLFGILALLLCIGFVVILHIWAIKPIVKGEIGKKHIIIALAEGGIFYLAIWFILNSMILPTTNFTSIAFKEMLNISPYIFAYFGGLGYLILQNQLKDF